MTPLTKAAVRQAAEMLMDQHTETTTLEVKNQLRQQGYKAVQREVSALMDELCAEANWEFEFNGRNRIYRRKKDLDKAILNLLFSAN